MRGHAEPRTQDETVTGLSAHDELQFEFLFRPRGCLFVLARRVPEYGLLAETFHVESFHIHVTGIEPHRAAHSRERTELPVRTEIERTSLHQLARHLEMHLRFSHVDVHLAAERTVTVSPPLNVIITRSHLLRERSSAFERAVYQYRSPSRCTGK